MSFQPLFRHSPPVFLPPLEVVFGHAGDEPSGRLQRLFLASEEAVDAGHGGRGGGDGRRCRLAEKRSSGAGRL